MVATNSSVWQDITQTRQNLPTHNCEHLYENMFLLRLHKYPLHQLLTLQADKLTVTSCKLTLLTPQVL